MALSFLSTLPLINTNNSTSNSSPYKPIPKRTSIIISSSSVTDGLSSKDKKILLEKYGYDPNEMLSQSSTSKTRRRKGGEKKGSRDNNSLLKEEAKPKPVARTTHKLLQVLAGTQRRKKLLSPAGMDVQPMMEVVKGAAFDILQVAGGCPAALRPGRWLDLYSGTGSVRIEAISRGCSEAHFVEMDPWVISEVLRPNLEWTGFLEASVIHPLRVESFLERAEKLAVSSL